MLIAYIYIMETEIKDIKVEIATILNYKVTKQDLIEFDWIYFQEIWFNSFVIETNDFIYKINKKTKELRILQRFYKTMVDDSNMYESTDAIDYEVIRLCKIAKQAGFSYFLENKYMN